MERMKLARSISNANAGTKELSDFGFRIQLGGLQQLSGGGAQAAVGAGRRNSCSGHSDSSEELVVDGNDDEDEDAEGNDTEGGSLTVGDLMNL